MVSLYFGAPCGSSIEATLEDHPDQPEKRGGHTSADHSTLLARPVFQSLGGVTVREA